jgi:peptidase E
MKNSSIPPTERMRWLIWELGLISQNIGGIISFVNLRAYDLGEIKQRLEFADVIYIVGGMTSVLSKLIRDTGFDKILKKLANDKVIMGTSAGAMVLGRQVQNPEYWRSYYEEVEKFVEAPMLGMVDFNVRPHFGGPNAGEKDTLEFFTPLLENEKFPIYGLRDDQAVISDNGRIKFIGGEPLYLGAKI